jgi:2-polyprenyl-3-methyl-5-hydroxy-6-metoxy-1,4-benzoquinol methylase
LCGCGSSYELLNKRNISIWTNSGIDTTANALKYKCVIRQCKDCGHVYQPIDENLNGILNKIYLSASAQASTSLGKGNWGIERARAFLDALNIKGCKSALEIGCAQGHILRCLKDKGFTDLAGIDPSLDKTKEVAGIKYLKAFAGSKTVLAQKYDLIFANGVFEHIADIDEAIAFCRNNLNKNGRLFFSVPNAQKQLNEGDPALFMHQHLHYYTKKAIKYLLSKNGFKVESIDATQDVFKVNARLGKSSARIPKFVPYLFYKKRLEAVLGKINRFMLEKKIIVHGATNSLNNILGWLNKDFDFMLVDNDDTKQWKVFFGKKVHSILDLDLSRYEGVLIVPAAFYGDIKENYEDRGFNGRYESARIESEKYEG